MSLVTDADCDPHLSLLPRRSAGPDMARLAAQARRDLAVLAHPAAAWVRPISHPSGQHIDIRNQTSVVGIEPTGAALALRTAEPAGCDTVLARRVDICFRRTLLPVVNPHGWPGFSAIFAHYPELDDSIRWNIARHFDVHDQPPHPTPSIAHAGSRDSTLTPTAFGRRSVGQAMQSRLRPNTTSSPLIL
jgi:hypothetical protein